MAVLRLAAMAVLLMLSAFAVGNVGATSNATIETQIERLRWLYLTFNGPNWVPTRQKEWDTSFNRGNDSLVNVSTFWERCNHDAAHSLVVGIKCRLNGIYIINLPGYGITGPMASLNYTSFFGYFPSTSFQFPNNALHGPLATDWSTEATIAGLFLAGNQISGPLPDEIFMPALTQLDVSANPQLLVENLTSAVGQGSSLIYLNIAAVNGSGWIPDAICNIPLQQLMLTNNRFHTLPECFGPALKSTMTILNVYNNDFKGPVPQGWCNLTNLEQLNLSDNAFEGTLPECIKTFGKLTLLGVLNTNIKGGFPEYLFTHNTQLQTLELSGFHGLVPDSFDVFAGLKTVQLSGPAGVIHNQQDTFYGPLPTTLFASPTIVTIVLENTFLEGHVTGANFTNTPLLCQISLIENSLIGGTFPTELLTEVWTTPIDTKLQQFPRFFSIFRCPRFTGPLPDLTINQTKAIRDLDTANDEVFQLAFNNFYGWIPDSMARWLPERSMANVLQGNDHMYYPVQKPFWNWTSGYRGSPTSLGSISNGPFPTFAATTASINTTLTGQFPDAPTGTYRVALFEIVNGTAAETARDLFLYQNDTAAGASSLEQFVVANANATLGGDRDNFGYYTELSFVMPNVTRGTESLVALVFLDGVFRTDVNATVALVSGEHGAQVDFYDPRPTVTRIDPAELRPEGCVPLTLTGHGFRGAPQPTIRIESKRSLMAPVNDEILVSEGVTVHNDTTITFLLPFAVPGNYSATYGNFTIRNVAAYPVRVLPAGIARPTEVSPSSSRVLVGFIDTCPGALEPCRHHHTDPFRCPTPVCDCADRGACNLNQTNDRFQCACDTHFTGLSCDRCMFNRYGSDCMACDCEHGSCDWGRDNTGECECESGWMGKRCSVSKLAVGLGAGIPAAALVIGGGIFALLKLRGPKQFDPTEEPLQ